jgi:hypothetical protein
MLKSCPPALDHFTSTTAQRTTHRDTPPKDENRRGRVKACPAKVHPQRYPAKGQQPRGPGQQTEAA